MRLASMEAGGRCITELPYTVSWGK